MFSTLFPHMHLYCLPFNEWKFVLLFLYSHFKCHLIAYFQILCTVLFYCCLQLTLINQQIILNIFGISNFSIRRARMHEFEPWLCLMLANYPLANYFSESQFSHCKMRIIIISTSLGYCQN